MFSFLRYRMVSADLSAMREEIDKEVSKHRGWYIFEGLLFLVVGALALILPGATALAVQMLVATLLIISGLVQAFLFFRRRERWWRFISGILSIVAGGVMIAFPAAGLVALSIIVGIFLIFEGVTETGMAFVLRPFFNWWWLLISGLLALTLGVLVFLFLPVMGMLYIAIAVGINMIFYGISLLILAWKAGRREKDEDLDYKEIAV